MKVVFDKKYRLWTMPLIGLGLGTILLIRLYGWSDTQTTPLMSELDCATVADCDPVQYRPSQSGEGAGPQPHALALTVSHLVFEQPAVNVDSDRLNLPTSGAAALEPPQGAIVTKAGDHLNSEPTATVPALSPVKQQFLIPTPGATPLVQAVAFSSGGGGNTPDSPPASNRSDLAEQSLSSETATDVCPTASNAVFNLIPIEGPPADRPDAQHADLNLSLRGYTPSPAPLELAFYPGQTDGDPPQLAGLFQPNRRATIIHAYQVNDWNWACAERAHGCATGPIQDWTVTMVGLAATPGEPISPPERGPNIYGGGYKALVLYAAERQVTLGYTRQDTVATGYVVHIKDICVDPNLLALYRAQNDANGWRSSGRLPALRNDQILGAALREEVKVAIRDNGSFMDPRSSKDWWR